MVKVMQRFWMIVTHRTMVIHWCTKYGMTLSKDKKVVARTQSHVKTPINLTWGSKGQCRIGIMEIDPCAKYDMPVSNRRYGLNMKKSQNPINLTLRSKVNVVSGSRMYVTHCLIVIHPWAKYDMPMLDRNLHRQTDQTDRQIDSYVPPFIACRVYKNK